MGGRINVGNLVKGTLDKSRAFATSESVQEVQQQDQEIHEEDLNTFTAVEDLKFSTEAVVTEISEADDLFNYKADPQVGEEVESMESESTYTPPWLRETETKEVDDDYVDPSFEKLKKNTESQKVAIEETLPETEPKIEGQSFDEKDLNLLEDINIRSESEVSDEDVGHREGEERLVHPEEVSIKVKGNKEMYEEALLSCGMSQVIETFALRIIQSSEIANVALSSFGKTAEAHVPKLLKNYTFNNFKFIGRDYRISERDHLFCQLEDKVKRNIEAGKPYTVIRVVGEVIYEGITYLTYWLDDEMIKAYTNAFGRKVLFDPNDLDERNLHVVIMHE